MTSYETSLELGALTLGRATEYCSEYDPSLLQSVPRALNRKELNIEYSQPFFGEDVWNGYELSWLNEKGKPVVFLARFVVPSDSKYIIESKSFKLYLNSFNQTRFSDPSTVKSILMRDLEKLTEGVVNVTLFPPDDIDRFELTCLPGDCLDELDISIDDYQLNPSPLKLAASTSLGLVVNETLHSHLLKSNCLITNQPDWASVIVEYRGQPIDHEALLRYLISFRQHNEFHEQCVERIFIDLFRTFDLTALSVQALYTRRGGLDINPYRSTIQSNGSPLFRINRQ